MREIYRNPMLYYLLIPALVGLWPLLVVAVYLPNANTACAAEQALCVEGQSRVMDILVIDPERPINIRGKDKSLPPTEFSYGAAVTQVANLCKIPSSNCKYTVGGFMTSGGKKRQDARVTLTNIQIRQAADFLWTLQSKYLTRLTCENVKLQKKKGMPDQWDVDFSFLYYY